jgi:hypothetical protein
LGRSEFLNSRGLVSDKRVYHHRLNRTIKLFRFRSAIWAKIHRIHEICTRKILFLVDLRTSFTRFYFYLHYWIQSKLDRNICSFGPKFQKTPWKGICQVEASLFRGIPLDAINAHDKDDRSNHNPLSDSQITKAGVLLLCGHAVSSLLSNGLIGGII